MRSILFCCTLMLVSYTASLAQQSDNKAGSTAQSKKILFASDINKFDAGVQRNNKELRDKSYEEMISIMEEQVGMAKEEVKNATGGAAKELQGKITDELQIIKEVSAMGNADKVKNRAAIKAKLESFQRFL